MIFRRIVTALILAGSFSASILFAFETDQYNLPDTPLADSGEEISAFVSSNLRDAIDDLNREIGRSEVCLRFPVKGCETPERERNRLVKLQRPDAPATALFKRIGDGNLFITKFGKWLYSHQFRSTPASYKPHYSESIFVLNPLDYATSSPTYRLYGSEFGGDKLEHLLQQGYKYYTIYNEERSNGRTEADAAARAIAWGKRTERTYFGLLSSGVYSNADLFANFAGLKFYLSLTGNSFGHPQASPVVSLVDGRWGFVAGFAGEHLLRPFITDHLNEAFNPSSFRLTLFKSVRREVKKHACPKWQRAFPMLSRSEVETKTASLETWDGEDYGYTRRSRTVTISETCVTDSEPAPK